MGGVRVRKLAVWTLLCILLVGVAPTVMAAPQVTMTVQPANEGRVKQNGWVTLQVELLNQGGDLEGELVVEEESQFSHPQYVVPYALPAGGRKRIPVSLTNSSNSPLSVKLYAGGQLVESSKVNLTWVPYQSAFIGVLSNDELGLPALSQLQAGQSAPQVVRLTAASLADKATLLADFNLIALSRFDTASLSPEQIRALELWVTRGGTLVVAGGPEWRRTLGPLPEALRPVAVTGVEERSLAALGSLAGTPLEAAGPISVGRVTSGEPLLQVDGQPLVVSNTVGAGRVLYLAFDPGLTPLAGWAGQPALFNRLVGNAGVVQGWGGDPYWQMQDALQRLPDWGLPGVWTIALFLGGYLLLIGPVNYLLLRRLDRREWAWMTLPLGSILFVGIVYLLGFGRFQPLVSHLITVTEISPGTGSATAGAYLGIYAPSRGRLAVSVPEGQLALPFARRSTESSSVSARVVAGEKTTVELLGLSNFGMSGFHLERDVSITGGLALVDAKMSGGQLTGRVQNSTTQPIAGVVVGYGPSATVIGELAPGQTSEPFEMQVQQFDQAPFEKGPIFNAYNWDGLTGSLDHRDADWSRRGAILNFVRERLMSRPSTGVILLGWTDQPLVDPAIPALGKRSEGANLVYSVVSPPMDVNAGEIPAGVIQGYLTPGSGSQVTPMGYYLNPGSHQVTLLLPPLDPSKVASIELDLRRTVLNGQLLVSVKNQQTGDWLPFTEQRMALTNWQSVVAPSGLIELRYDAAVDNEVPAPTVAVRGVGR